MGLFDRFTEKKVCDICGEDIGLLGNRKLDDGNMCKDCAKNLSPFLSGRKKMTLDDIRQHLAYREENKARLAQFHPTRQIGERWTVYVDENAGRFVVSQDRDWRKNNPDVLDIASVLSANVDIREKMHLLSEHDKEERRKNPQLAGYRDPRLDEDHEFEYEFRVIISIDNPWFSEIEFELSSQRPKHPQDRRYQQLMQESNELRMSLMNPAFRQGGTAPQMGFGTPQPGYAQPQAGFSSPQPGFAQPQGGFAAAQPGHGQPQSGFGAPQPGFNQPQAGFNQPQGGVQPSNNPAMAAGMWLCGCGAQNSGKFCTACASPRPTSLQCDKCGWMPAPEQAPPGFCPNCGDPFDHNDMR